MEVASREAIGRGRASHGRAYALLALFVVGIMLFCTKASPLFVFHDNYDVNVYLTMGRGMMRGAVPYRDLFEGKGPLLYLLYGLASMVDRTGFLGVFGLILLAQWGACVMAYKIADHYLHSPTRSFCVAACLPLFILENSFYAQYMDYGGGPPDELMLPLVLGGLYLLLRYRVDTGDAQAKNMCLQGVLAGCVFMMKFPNTVLWAGLLLPLAVRMAVRGRWKKLLVECGATLGGFALVALPFVVYLLATGALDGFMDASFRYNMQYTSAGMTFAQHLRHTALKALDFARSYWRYTAVVLFGFAFLLFQKPRRPLVFAGAALGFLLLGGVIFWGFVYPYAVIPMMAFSVFALVAAFGLIPKAWTQKVPRRAHIPLLAVCLLLLGALIVRQNALVRSDLFRLGREPLETVQRQVAALLRAEGEEEPTLLQVGLQDAGFYTAAGTVPRERFFTTLNSTYAAYPRILDAQLASIRAGKNDFVLLTWTPGTLGHLPEEERAIYDALFQATEERYELVRIVEGTALQAGIPFSLYRLKPEV